MTEPTDHRALAEKWLTAASTAPGSSNSREMALIGIGHALLAAPERLSAGRAASYNWSPKTWGDDNRLAGDALRDGHYEDGDQT